jgi:3',5'-cyclic-AMP phosphodiesterase
MPVHIPPISRRKFISSTALATAGLLFGFKSSIPNNNVDPDYFILLADTHIDQNPNRIVRDEFNLAGNLKLAVNRILENKSRMPAAVIINGDAAISRGLAEDYRTLIKLLNPISEAGIPIHITMGNHDDRGPFYEVLPEMRPDEVFVDDSHNEIIETPHTYLFLLDTLDQVNEAPGILGQPQLDWLDEALQQYKDKPVMLFGHHTTTGLQDMNKLYEVTHRHRHVKAYFFGHSHRWIISKHQDLHLINHPTTAYVFDENEPLAFVHADFKSDHVKIRLDCLDRRHVWHGQEGSLRYRPD